MLSTVHIALAVLLLGVAGNLSAYYTTMRFVTGDGDAALVRSLRANLTSALEESEGRARKLEESGERARRLESELTTSYSNYLIHIPKAGGYSAFEYLSLDRAELSAVPLSKKQAQVCNHGGQQIEGWRKWKPCWMRRMWANPLG